MKKIYVLIVFLFTIFLLGSNQNVEVKAESSSSGDLSITLNERLPKSFIVNSATPDFKPYFIVRLGTVRQEITDEQIDLGGFNVATIGDFVGFGTANLFEGSGPTAELANDKAARRKALVDTNDNAADFEVVTADLSYLLD